ncbi:hypothetical protein AB0C31_51860, partial [Actinoplanes philippinensis]
ALLRHPDLHGRRVGLHVPVAERLGQQSVAVQPDLDRRVPADLRADMAPRDPKNIPRPRLLLPTVRLPEEPAAPPPSVRRIYLLNLALCAAVLLAVVTGVVDLAEIRWVTGTYPFALPPAQLFAMGLVAARGAWALPRRGLIRFPRLSPAPRRPRRQRLGTACRTRWRRRSNAVPARETRMSSATVSFAPPLPGLVETPA